MRVIIPVPDKTQRVERALKREKIEFVLKRNSSVSTFFARGIPEKKLARALRDSPDDVLLILSAPFPYRGGFSFMELKDRLRLLNPANLYFRGMEVTSYSPGWGGLLGDILRDVQA